jgi:hypothetical protein
MLGNTSVSMMVLLVASSLIGISSIYQYIEGQTPAPTPRTTKSIHLEGRVAGTIMSTSPSKTCTAFVELPLDPGPTLLGVPPGTYLTLTAPIESCTLFGLAKIGNIPIQFDVPAPADPSNIPREYRLTTVIL